MTVEELKEQLTSYLPPLFECDALGENRFRVRTPLIFPDGGVVDVFVSKSDGLYTVTDYGDAMGWLDMRSAATGIAPKQRSLVADACRTHGIELKGGHVMLQEHRGKGYCSSQSCVSRRQKHLWGTFGLRCRRQCESVRKTLKESRGSRLYSRFPIARTFHCK